LEECEASASIDEPNDNGVLKEVEYPMIAKLRESFNDFFDTNPEWEFTLPGILRFMFHDSVMANTSDSSGSGCLKWLMPGALEAGTTCDTTHKNLVPAVEVMRKLDATFAEILSDSTGREVRLSWPDVVVFSAACAVDRAMPIEAYTAFVPGHYLSSQVGFGRPDRNEKECQTLSLADTFCNRVPKLKSRGNSWSERMPPNHKEIFEKMERDGLTAEDTVAFMGAHTFGFSRQFGWAEADDDFSAGPWTTTPTVFNNEYFHILLRLSDKYMEELEIREEPLKNEPCLTFSEGLDPTKKSWKSATDWCQLFGADAPKVDSLTGCPDKFCPAADCVDGELNDERSDCKESFDTRTLVLDSDLAMIITGNETMEGGRTNRYLPFVQEFASSQIKFFVQFQQAFLKWSELGVEVNHPLEAELPRLDDPELNPATNAPSVKPTTRPSHVPTLPVPTFFPSPSPSQRPTTSLPSKQPVAGPTRSPSTSEPSLFPSTSPVVDPIATDSILQLAATEALCRKSDPWSANLVYVPNYEVLEFGYCYQHADSFSVSEGNFCRFSSISVPLFDGCESFGCTSSHVSWEDCANRCSATSSCKAFGLGPEFGRNYCALYSDYPDRTDTYSHGKKTQCWVKQADSTSGRLRGANVLFRGKGLCANAGRILLQAGGYGVDVTGIDALSSVASCEAACRVNTGPRQCFAFSFSRNQRCDLHMEPAARGLESTTVFGESWNNCYEVVYGH